MHNDERSTSLHKPFQLGDSRFGVFDVFYNGATKQNGFLGHDADLLPVAGLLNGINGYAINAMFFSTMTTSTSFLIWKGTARLVNEAMTRQTAPAYNAFLQGMRRIRSCR